MEELTGTLHYIKYRNESNFLIATFVNSNHQEVCALGTMMNPEPGLQYKLAGTWKDDPRWGRQFQIRQYQTIVPTSVDGILRYLQNLNCGIGPVIGRNLVGKYGTKALEVLKTKPRAVAKRVKGLSTVKAEEIAELLLRNEKYEAVKIELNTLLDVDRIRKTLIDDLLEKYKLQAAEVVKADPYCLTGFRGIGFPTVDTVAVVKVKIEKTDVRRQRAAIIHLLQQNAINGNVWIDGGLLKERSEKLTECDCFEGFTKLLEAGEIVTEEKMVTLAHMAKDEFCVSKRVHELVDIEKDIPF